MDIENVIIVGTGPAGLVAAIYTGRANLEPLVLIGQQLGGQVSTTNEIENFPGFPDGITGPELVERVQRQAENFGARLVFDEVTEVDFSVHPFRVKTYEKEHLAKTVIITTGASARKLGVPREVELTGRGVSYCGTCDGFFFTDKDVVVVGGGDSALEEAIFLTRFVRSVKIIHRRDQLRAGFTLRERARKNEKISFVWDTVITEINGEDGVESVTLQNVKTGEESVMPTDGVFIFIGHIPNSQLFEGQLDLDEQGHVIVDQRTRTSTPGILAAGEISDPFFRQAIVSAGEGAKAAMEADKYLAELEERAYPSDS